ncbi:MAG: murein L,D-transpeptidase family protein [Bdellovibrio sp.]|jgi:murein L,D-transpeptidase YafK
MKHLLCLLLLFKITQPAFANGVLKDAQSPTFPSGLLSLGDHSRVIFVADKTRRFLRVYEFQNKRPHLVLEVPSDIGKNNGDKERENDYKTPVGIYFLQQKRTPPEIPFSLYGSIAFTTDYPNIFDQRDKKGGSGIWLHAVPDTVPLTRGSRGCVVVRDDVVKKLAQFVRLKETPIVIYDQVEDLKQEDYDLEQKKYLTFFEEWRKAWETQDADTYIKFYDETFQNNQMNYSQWYNHKKKLKSQYKFIKVSLSEPLIIRNRGQVVIRTLQEYESDQHKDYGIKTIHAAYSPTSGFKIIREDWAPRGRLDTKGQATEIAAPPPRTTASEKVIGTPPTQ